MRDPSLSGKLGFPSVIVRLTMAFLLHAMLLTGCSGGGGGGTGDSSPSPISPPPGSAPAAPTNVIPTWFGFSAQPYQASLAWDPVGGATSYNIYYATEPGVTPGNYTTKAGATKVSAATNPYLVNGLPATNGITYYFVVTAVNADGESSPSVEVSASPVSLSVTSTRENRLRLSWEYIIAAVPDLKGFRVYQVMDVNDETKDKLTCEIVENKDPLSTNFEKQITTPFNRTSQEQTTQEEECKTDPPFVEDPLVNYLYRMTAFDSNGNESEKSATVAANKSPVARITATGNNRGVLFTAEGSSDPDGTVTAYAWSFSDGGTSPSQTVNHNFTAAGSHTISLTVTDNQGAATSIDMTLPLP